MTPSIASGHCTGTLKCKLVTLPSLDVIFTCVYGTIQVQIFFTPKGGTIALQSHIGICTTILSVSMHVDSPFVVSSSLKGLLKHLPTLQLITTGGERNGVIPPLNSSPK